MPALAQNPCLRLCSWGPTGDDTDGLPLFRCRGCASEWVRTEPWSPADADGTRPPELLAELRRR